MQAEDSLITPVVAVALVESTLTAILLKSMLLVIAFKVGATTTELQRRLTAFIDSQSCHRVLRPLGCAPPNTVSDENDANDVESQDIRVRVLRLITASPPSHDTSVSAAIAPQMMSEAQAWANEE